MRLTFDNVYDLNKHIDKLPLEQYYLIEYENNKFILNLLDKAPDDNDGDGKYAIETNNDLPMIALMVTMVLTLLILGMVLL